MARIDHLVVAARHLEAGAAWLEARLGATLMPGGAHALMGTHNRLLRLAGQDALYLEVIAIDPAAPPPGLPRWFGLDSPSLQARIAERPRLVHWVARSTDLTQEAMPWHGAITPMRRGDFRWRITVPADGALPWEGLLPTLIQWESPDHPTERLPDSGCTLMKLEGFHPAHAELKTRLRALGLEQALALFPAEPEDGPALVAYLKTPHGLVELD